MNKNTLILVYELEQVKFIVDYLKEKSDTVQIVALNFWIEEELKSKGFSPVSFSDYRPLWSDHRDSQAISEKLAREWYQLQETAFLQYKGLRIGEMFEAVLDMYLQEVIGSMLVVECILDKNPKTDTLVVPNPTGSASATSGPFARFQIQAMSAVASEYARHRGISFESVGVYNTKETSIFPKQPLIRRILLKLYNLCISLAPRRTLRIYVSDHWRNVKQVLEQIYDAELVFIDRREISHIPWSALWRHRVRFLHPLDILTPKIRQISHAEVMRWRLLWIKAKQTIGTLAGFTYKDFYWWPIVEPAFRFLVEKYAERIVADIESIQSVLVQCNINRTLLRASVSGQHHFFILGELPRRDGIPTIEIQHGLGVGNLNPNSAFGFLHAEYLAAYGEAIQRRFVLNGYDIGRIKTTGSPRFDRYYKERDLVTSSDRERECLSLELDPKHPIALVVMPAEHPAHLLGGIDLTSYEMISYLNSLSYIKNAVPNLQYIIKFRSRDQQELYLKYIQGLFKGSGVSYVSGDLFKYALLSNFVYSPFSTAVVECMMARRPVLLYPIKSSERFFYDAHKDGLITVPLISEKSGLPVNKLVDETRKLTEDKVYYAREVEKGDRFLAANYTFDGKASQHVANFLRTVSYRLPT